MKMDKVAGMYIPYGGERQVANSIVDIAKLALKEASDERD